MQLDLTGVAVSILTGVFSILAVVLPMLINARLKDAQAAATLGAAVRNSLGAIEQASLGAVNNLHPSAPPPAIPGVTPRLTAGVTYVIDHAGEEAARFGISPAAIADKISAQIGLKNLEADTAASAASVRPGPPKPLAATFVPVPVGGPRVPL